MENAVLIYGYYLQNVATEWKRHKKNMLNEYILLFSWGLGGSGAFAECRKNMQTHH